MTADAARWAKYVAIGDSFTEGLWDTDVSADWPGGSGTPEQTGAPGQTGTSGQAGAPAGFGASDQPGTPGGTRTPGQSGRPEAAGTSSQPRSMFDNTPLRGWADRLAGALSARRVAAGLAPLEYANLAIRGRLAWPIIRDQLPQALAMKPDLISIVGGGNDILRLNTDIPRILTFIDGAVRRARATGADVLLSTSVKADGPLIGLTEGRAARYCAGLWSIAQRHGAHVIDLHGAKSLGDLRLWAHDRIHLIPEGHRRVANAALAALGFVPDDPAWDTPLPPPGPRSLADQLRSDAEWFADDVVPWAVRHFQHRSSGDGRLPKRPELTPMPPADARGEPS